MNETFTGSSNSKFWNLTGYAGPTVTTSATADEKGAWTAILTTPSWTAEGMTLIVSPFATGNWVLSIDIAAGDDIIVKDLKLDCRTSSNYGMSCSWDIPVRVQPGVTLYARGAVSVGGTARTFYALPSLYAGGFGFRGFNKMEYLGDTGNANVTDSWVFIGMAFTGGPQYKAFMVQPRPASLTDNDGIVLYGTAGGGYTPDGLVLVTGFFATDTQADRPIHGVYNTWVPHHEEKDALIIYLGMKSGLTTTLNASLYGFR